MSVSPRDSPAKPRDDGPVFAEPWHAQVLAVADALVRAGRFSASDWSQALGAAIREMHAGDARDEDDAYYRAALLALERLVDARCAIGPDRLAERVDAWRDAYRRTPHGKPVTLED